MSNGDESNGNGSGNGKRKVFDVRDVNHWSFVVNTGQFVMLVGAIFWFADMRNEWKDHKESDKRHWQITWSLPEMVHWVTAASKTTKMEYPDPYDTRERFKGMKE